MIDDFLLFIELIAFVLLLAPFGNLMLEAAFRLVDFHPAIRIAERVIISTYCSGFFLFTLSYIPLNLFGPAHLIWILVSVGVIGWSDTARRYFPATRGTWLKMQFFECTVLSWVPKKWSLSGHDRESLSADKIAPRNGSVPASQSITGDHPPTVEQSGLRPRWSNSELITRLGVAGALSALTAFLLGFEVVVAGTQSFPNTFDGSRAVDFTSLLLSTGHSSLSLNPIAAEPITYPQGSAVWFAAATVTFHWPLAQAEVLLPPLFMALSVPAAYTWGKRAFAFYGDSGRRAGLILASADALLLTWPRFLVGGYYDFLFALPLFLVGMSWLSEPLLPWLSSWKRALLFGGCLGVLATLSPVPVEFLLLVSFIVAFSQRRAISLKVDTILARYVSITAVVLACCMPSIVAAFVYWSYPSHGLASVAGGSSLGSALSSNPLGAYAGLSDPFFFGPQFQWLSPFLVLKVELLLLLLCCLLLVILRAASPETGWAFLRNSDRVLKPLLISVGVGLVLLFTTTVTPAEVPGLAVFDELSSPLELSILLFVVYGFLATLPLIYLVEYLSGQHFKTRRFIWKPNPFRPGETSAMAYQAKGPHRPITKLRTAGNRTSILALAVILAIPLGSGFAVTVTQGPNYLETGVMNPLSNVSLGDQELLEYTGSNLPDCSTVFVAPGSAGEFLPAFNPRLHIDFPVDPEANSNSYSDALTHLTDGNYTSGVRADLLQLGITEVLVTGVNNVLWKSIDAVPLLDSSDFSILYSASSSKGLDNSGLYLLEFVPGVNALGCLPTTT